jgi:hypothetical protein
MNNLTQDARRQTDCTDTIIVALADEETPTSMSLPNTDLGDDRGYCAPSNAVTSKSQIHEMIKGVLAFANASLVDKLIAFAAQGVINIAATILPVLCTAQRSELISNFGRALRAPVSSISVIAILFAPAGNNAIYKTITIAIETVLACQWAKVLAGYVRYTRTGSGFAALRFLKPCFFQIQRCSR